MSVFGRQHFPFTLRRPVTVARPSQSHRHIACPHCGESLRVGVRAINTRCTACHKNLLLEDVVVRGDSIRTRIITGGSILIEPNARFAGVLQADRIVIAGRVMGTIIGTTRVEVTATGKVAGTIATHELAADPHALIDGQINILNADGSITSMTTGPDHAPPRLPTHLGAISYPAA